MYTFTLQSIQPRLTPWGREVQLRLQEQGVSQDALCAAMRAKGYAVAKEQISMMLRGRGIKGKLPMILSINDYLGIPYDHHTMGGGEREDGESNEGG